MLQKKFKFLLIFITYSSGISCLEPQQNHAFTQKIKFAVASVTNKLLSAGDANVDNNISAQTLFRSVDAKSDLPVVKKMNKAMEYLFGYKNTFALPGLNQIYINEEWMNRLPEEQKKFILGRTIGWLKNGHKYLAIQFFSKVLAEGSRMMLMPTREIDIKDSFHKLYNCIAYERNLKKRGSSTAEETIELINLRQKFLDAIYNRNELIQILCILLSDIIDNYANCLVEDDADAYAIEKFDCLDGAKAVINDLANYEHDNSFLGKICSYFPISYLSLLAITTHFENTASGLTLINEYMPGRLHNTPSKLGFILKNLLCFNYLNMHPRISS